MATQKTKKRPGPSRKAKSKAAPPKKGKSVRPRTGKLSAIDAAAKVLAETQQSMTCQAMIDAMAERGYWTSPAGRTPQATLYAAIARQISTKGADSRFVKVERGKFALKHGA
jgi:hypothetical protein